MKLKGQLYYNVYYKVLVLALMQSVGHNRLLEGKHFLTKEQKSNFSHLKH